MCSHRFKRNIHTGRAKFAGAIEKDIIMEKLKEWHIELEDNKPEERTPWKEQI